MSPGVRLMLLKQDALSLQANGASLYAKDAFHKVVKLAPRPRLWTSAPFDDDHDTITCYQLTCLPVESSRQVFVPVCCVAPTFSKHVAGIKFRTKSLKSMG